MSIKKITLKKEYKIGLPNYSNMTCGMEMNLDTSRGEIKEKEINDLWGFIEDQLKQQINNSNYINKQNV